MTTVQALLDELTASGEEVGLQVAVAERGQGVRSWQSGHTSRTRQAAVSEQTLFPLFSLTKGLVAIALCADAVPLRDLLGRTLGETSEAFRAAPGAEITMRDVLTHTAGLPYMPAGLSAESVCDSERITRTIAGLPLEWRPGTKMGYHAYTFGWLIAPFLAALSGNSDPHRVLDDVVASQSDQSVFFRIAEASPVDDVAEISGHWRGHHTVLERAIPVGIEPSQSVFGNPRFRAAGIIAAGAFGTAVGVARAYSRLAWDAPVGLDPVAVREITRTRVGAVDAVNQRFAYRSCGLLVGWEGGRAHPETSHPPFDHDGVVGHTAAGGSVAWVDLARGRSVAILHNHLSPDGWRAERIQRIVHAVRRSIEDFGGQETT